MGTRSVGTRGGRLSSGSRGSARIDSRNPHAVADRLASRLDSLSSERRRELLDAAWAQSLLTAHGGASRIRTALWPIVQTAVAATIAWVIATRAFGHQGPFFAPVAAIMALGATRGQRARRAG